MKYPPALRFGLALAALALSLPSLSSAAPDNPAPTAKPANEAKPTPFVLEIRNGDILENGKSLGPATVGNILDYLKKRNEFFSLSLGPGTANVRIGNMLLRLPEFNIAQICEAISSSSGFQIRTGQTQADSGVWGLALNDVPAREVAVFNLSSYLNPDGKAEEKTIKGKLASVTDIILKTLNDLEPNSSNNPFVAPSETAASDGSGNNPSAPSFQFHNGASLLVVTGSHQAIQISGQVINALTQSAQTPLNYAANADRNVAALRDAGRIASLLQALVSKWAQTDPQAARQLIQTLSSADPITAAQWLSTPPSPDSQAALQWALTLPDTDPSYRKTLESSTFNHAQWEAIRDKLMQVKEQGSLSQEQLKQLQQTLDNINKQLEDTNPGPSPGQKPNPATADPGSNGTQP